jgi:hypothetical protein
MTKKPVYTVDSVKLSLNKSNPPQLVITAVGTTQIGVWRDLELQIRENGFVNGAYDFDLVGLIPLDHPTAGPVSTGEVRYTFTQIPTDLRTINVHAETNSKSASYPADLSKD